VEKGQTKVNIAERAEFMTLEHAARALSLLARWAGRRVEHRLAKQRNVVRLTPETQKGCGSRQRDELTCRRGDGR
jgi:hypothetical protein